MLRARDFERIAKTVFGFRGRRRIIHQYQLALEPQHFTIHPTDDEAHGIWIRQPGMTAEHVTRLEDNWWGLGSGPCGPEDAYLTVSVPAMPAARWPGTWQKNV